jgi:UbiD family decarboxylase
VQTGWLNVGTYRVQAHDRELAGINKSPRRHGRAHMNPYRARGEDAPVMVVCGADPTLLVASAQFLPWQVSEYDFLGWLRGAPVEVVESKLTGLPLPATAELVIEGEILPPEVEMRDEGPFGEWAGYFTGGPGKKALVVKVQRVLFRDDPIQFGIPPMKPPLIWDTALPLRAAAVWEQLEAAGQEGIAGVWQLCSNSGPLILVVALRQQYAGQVKQVGAAAATCRAGASGGKWVIVVDDDIDITNAEDVLWAVATRAKADNIDFLHNIWTSRADEALDPEVKYGGHPVSTRAIIDACKPFPRLKTYTPTNDFSRPYKQEIAEKFGL